jgi:hypothetical protein
MTGRTRARDRRGRAKFRTVGVFRTLFVVLFAAIVLTIAVYFARHVRAPQNLEPEQKRGVPDTPNVKEQVSIVQFNFAVGRMEARAARNVEIDEKTGRLEGSVSVVDHGKKGGREIRFFADSVTYAKDWSRFFLEGRVKIRHGEIVVDASDFLYEKEADSFTTSKGVTLTAPRFSGSSRSASYSLRDEDFVLEGDLRLNVLPRLSAVPVVLSGPRARLTYSPRRRQAVIEGGVDIAYGRSRGGAERVGFDQFEKVDDISLLWLDGGARIAVEGEVGPKANPAAGKNAPAALPEDMTISRDFLFDRSLRQEIEADEIRFRAYLDGGGPGPVRLQVLLRGRHRDRNRGRVGRCQLQPRRDAPGHGFVGGRPCGEPRQEQGHRPADRGPLDVPPSRDQHSKGERLAHGQGADQGRAGRRLRR